MDAEGLTSLCSEGLRYLVFRKQKAGSDFRICVRNASEAVASAIGMSEFDEEIELV